MNLLGLDPGIPNFGWAVVKDGKRPTVIRSGRWHVDITLPPAERIAHSAAKIRELVAAYRPDAIGVETWTFQGRGNTLGIPMAQLVGASIAVCGAQVLTPTVQQWKAALGLPRDAKDDEVMTVVCRLTDGWRPETMHEVSGIGIALWAGARALVRV